MILIFLAMKKALHEITEHKDLTLTRLLMRVIHIITENSDTCTTMNIKENKFGTVDYGWKLCGKALYSIVRLISSNPGNVSTYPIYTE